jgi:hypothetical protein
MDSDEDLARQALDHDDPSRCTERACRCRRRHGGVRRTGDAARRGVHHTQRPHRAVQRGDGGFTAARACPVSSRITERRAFQLVTPASEQRVNSTFGGLKAQQRDLRCEMHPAGCRRGRASTTATRWCCERPWRGAAPRLVSRRRAPRHPVCAQGRVDCRFPHRQHGERPAPRPQGNPRSAAPATTTAGWICAAPPEPRAPPCPVV